jgi:predicted acylesterase/phospholipase RssA
MFILLIFFYIILMNTIKNIIISGGGGKSFAFIGLLQQLELDSVTNFTGVSSGSIIIYLLSIGYTPFELEQLALNLDLAQFMGNPSIANIFDKLAISDNLQIKLVLQTLTNYKLNKDSITFLEHFNITNKTIHIGLTCLSTASYSIFNKINTPGINIIDAILASCAIPGIFPSVNINNKYYCDGGIFNNFPIHIYDNELENTIGIIFEKKKKDKFNNIFEYITYAYLLPSDSKQLNQFEKYNKHIIIIKDHNLPLIQFNFTKASIKNIIDHGKNHNNYKNKNEFLQKLLIKKS